MNEQPPIENIDRLFSDVQSSVEARAMEAMREVFHRLPWGAEFALQNGGDAVLVKFIEPRLNYADAENYPERPQFGFDVRAKDGSWHLEFHCFQTGWGGRPVGLAPIEPPK